MRGYLPSGSPPPRELTDQERKDNERALEYGVLQASWLWPASFFIAPGDQPPNASQGQHLNDAYQTNGSALVNEWYKQKYFKSIPLGSPPDLNRIILEPGDVLIFGGGHSVIATGNGDEVSHMSWSRAIQFEAWIDGRLPDTTIHDSSKPPEAPPPGSADPGSGYMVTRDRIPDLVQRWKITGLNFKKPCIAYKLRPQYRDLGDFTYLSPLKDVFFGFNSVRLDDAARKALNADLQWVRANPNTRLLIEGHCDERGTAPVNLAVGKKRALAVQDFLTAGGMDPYLIFVVSFGKERPFVQGHDESAWEFNRRAHLVILK
jgi:outer membrane protein OmpA-like peptidoglycan-associated protein